jgi:hypothetical protein
LEHRNADHGADLAQQPIKTGSISAGLNTSLKPRPSASGATWPGIWRGGHWKPNETQRQQHKSMAPPAQDGDREGRSVEGPQRKRHHKRDIRPKAGDLARHDPPVHLRAGVAADAGDEVADGGPRQGRVRLVDDLAIRGRSAAE